jgi:uncharacterized protein (DUF427 family)
MGLSWQQGPLAPGAAGRFLVAEPLPERLLYAEPLRDIADGVLQLSDYTTRHADLGPTSWFTVRSGDYGKQRAAWQHTELPGCAAELKGRVAFAWRAMDAFYEEDERIVGHAADPYHRIDIRQTSRRLVVRSGDRVVADSSRPLALYESGFAPRWYVPSADVDEAALTPATGQTFCPYKGLCSYYDIGAARRAAWSYQDACAEVGRIGGFISFEPDLIEVHIDDARLRLEPGQSVIPHGIDRDLTTDAAISGSHP